MTLSPPTRHLAALAMAGLLATTVACSSDDGPAASHDQAERGSLVSAQALPRLSAEQIRRGHADDARLAAKVRNGVDRFTIHYRTTDAAGKPVEATGLAALPVTKKPAFRLLSYTHGTLVYKGDAPSSSDAEDLAIVPAANGAIVSAPDYLGLGAGPGPHPYLDKKTETTASLDMLKATIELAGQKGYRLDHRVEVVGFSQGARIALSLSRALQRGEAGRLSVSHVAAISGPFDLQGAEIPGTFEGRVAEPAAVYYLAYWTVAMNRLHHLYDSPAEALVDPSIARLFDGTHEEKEVFAQLPTTLDQTLTKAYQARLRHPRGALLEAMRSSDGTCRGVKIKAPVRLFYSPRDLVVDPANTRHCLAQLKSAGDEVTTVRLKTPDHLTSVSEALPIALDWFGTL